MCSRTERDTREREENKTGITLGCILYERDMCFVISLALLHPPPTENERQLALQRESERETENSLGGVVTRRVRR